MPALDHQRQMNICHYSSIQSPLFFAKLEEGFGSTWIWVLKFQSWSKQPIELVAAFLLGSWHLFWGPGSVLSLSTQEDCLLIMTKDHSMCQRLKKLPHKDCFLHTAREQQEEAAALWCCRLCCFIIPASYNGMLVWFLPTRQWRMVKVLVHLPLMQEILSEFRFHLFGLCWSTKSDF